MATTAPAPALSLPRVHETKLSAKQDALLLSLERRMQLHVQAERNASLRLHKQPETGDHAATVKEFLKQNLHRLDAANADPAAHSGLHGFRQFANAVDACGAEWKALYAHAHKSFALVEEMEESHEHVVSKTQALYDSFENILQQVEALNTRVELVAAPMPHFVAIDGVARALGFGVKFATPATANGAAPASSAGLQQPVQVFQHKRSIDPTTPAFQHALEQIDVAVAYLEAHKEFKDAVCYIEAYRTLTAGAIQCLKDYAISGLDAARDAVLEAVARARAPTINVPAATVEIDETSPYYVHFQLVAPSLVATARQLERLASSNAEAANATAYMANVMALAEVCNAYATQRVALLAPVLTSYLEALATGADLVSLLRMSGAYLVRVCDAEFRLFLKLFGRPPSDDLFVFKPPSEEDDDEDDDEQTAFERLMFQLSGVLYNVVRPALLAQKELETLCEVIMVLRSELIESVIAPRAAVVGFVQPVLHRMVQDAQERLILCVQKFIRDDIEGFTPTASDLAYPHKLTTSSPPDLYATWYPTLAHTLLCLARVYHYVNMDVFEELAQDAIQVCTASLKSAAADITVAQGPVHGALFLVKHLLTLREQITPFDITFSVRNKALDFSSSADALGHLLTDAGSIFRFSVEDNALVALFTQGIPVIHETTSDVKKELELQLKKSCTGFIDAVLELLARPLLQLMKKIAALGGGDLKAHAFTRPEHVAATLSFVAAQLRATLPSVRDTIHLYLRNAATEAILFQPIQRHLVDAVEKLQTLVEANYTRDERQASDAGFHAVLTQLRALA